MAETIVDDTTWDEFHLLVNMPSPALRDWLRAEQAGEATEGLPDEDGTLGHQVLGILGKRRADVTPDDVEAMEAVVELVRGLRGEDPLEPDAGPDDGWRHALMDVGHDPLRPVEAGRAP
ncbi:DUF3140 domain-containing protein [Nocardioides litoris]|uniref:DUF3140 domain-containing protein n=1 Tax=Nocardioides litoris TaxID=1926648 RepID=UPI001120E228|nr:DUF3140 domain-containing protein [Nocardioides litoris]